MHDNYKSVWYAQMELYNFPIVGTKEIIQHAAFSGLVDIYRIT